MLALAQIDYNATGRTAVVDRCIGEGYSFYLLDAQGVRLPPVHESWPTYEEAFAAAVRALD